MTHPANPNASRTAPAGRREGAADGAAPTQPPLTREAPSDSARLLLDTVYDAFRQTAVWPSSAALRVQLWPVMDVVDVAAELGPRLIDCASPDQEGGRCQLRLRALPLIPAAADDAQRVADAIRYLAGRYVAASGAPGSISSADLEREFGWPDAEVRRVSRLLGGVGGLFQSWGADGDGRLSDATLSSDVLTYQAVRSLDDYLAAVSAEEERRRQKYARQQFDGRHPSKAPPALASDTESREADRALSLEALHPTVVTHAAARFSSGHRNDAVLRALVAIEQRVRTLLGSTSNHLGPAQGRSSDLMGQAFGGPAPPLALSGLQTESQRNEQRGLMLIAQGAMAAIRNVLSHDILPEVPADEALEQLAIASWLHRRIDVAEARMRPPAPVKGEGS